MDHSDVIRHIEDGTSEDYFQERASNQAVENAKFFCLTKLILFLLSSCGLIMYIASAGAISCRMLEDATGKQSCHVNVEPFSNLWQASIYAMLGLNSCGAVLFLQCLILSNKLKKIKVKSTRRYSDARPEERRDHFGEKFTRRSSILDFNTQQIEYTSRCCDDVVLRAQFQALDNLAELPMRPNYRESQWLCRISDVQQKLQEQLEQQEEVKLQEQQEQELKQRELANKRAGLQLQSQRQVDSIAERIEMLLSADMVQISGTTRQSVLKDMR